MKLLRALKFCVLGRNPTHSRAPEEFTLDSLFLPSKRGYVYAWRLAGSCEDTCPKANQGTATFAHIWLGFACFGTWKQCPMLGDLTIGKINNHLKQNQVGHPFHTWGVRVVEHNPGRRPVLVWKMVATADTVKPARQAPSRHHNWLVRPSVVGHLDEVAWEP